MKTLEHSLNTIIQEQVSIKNMQFSSMAGRGTTDIIFILSSKKVFAKEEKHLRIC